MERLKIQRGKGETPNKKKRRKRQTKAEE